MLPISALILVVMAFFSTGLPSAPLYKQCDQRWGNQTMGDDTLCHQGCAMTSICMGLAAYGAELSGSHLITPLTFNTWIRENNGYLCIAGDCNNLNLTLVPQVVTEKSGFSLTYKGEVLVESMEDLVQLFDSGDILALHVRHQHHFVLMTGFDATSHLVKVHDPGFDQTTYPFSDVHDVIVYAVEKVSL